MIRRLTFLLPIALAACAATPKPAEPASPPAAPAWVTITIDQAKAAEIENFLDTQQHGAAKIVDQFLMLLEQQAQRAVKTPPK